MRGYPVSGHALDVRKRRVSDVPVPPVIGIAAGECIHDAIACDLGDDRDHGPNRLVPEIPLDRLPSIPRHVDLLGGGASLRNRDANFLFANTRRLASKVAQIVELRASHTTAAVANLLRVQTLAVERPLGSTHTGPTVDCQQSIPQYL